MWESGRVLTTIYWPITELVRKSQALHNGSVHSWSEQFNLYPGVAISAQFVQRMKSALSSVQLTLFALSQLSILEALVLPNFYTFGQSEGDQLVPTNDDGSSGTIPISIPFPFFDRNHNSLFVSITFLYLLHSNLSSGFNYAIYRYQLLYKIAFGSSEKRTKQNVNYVNNSKKQQWKQQKQKTSWSSYA